MSDDEYDVEEILDVREHSTEATVEYLVKGSLQIFSTIHEKMQISLKWLKYRLKIIISSFKYNIHTVTMVSKLKKYKKNTLG